MDDEYFMRLALDEAMLAYKEEEVPVGALLVIEGQVIAASHNIREKTHDPTAHAEVLVLREAAIKLGRWRLTDAVLYVTKEPCIMCAGAMINSRIGRLVYGCRDIKAGAVDSLYEILTDKRLNHRVEVKSGVLSGECAGLLKDFFFNRRGGRVVEGGGLENRCGGDSTGGSNPPFSASCKKRGIARPICNLYETSDI